MVTTGSIQLRPAKATQADGLAFARLLDQAGEGMFRLMLGRKSEPIVARAFLQPDHDLSYEYVTFAEQEGEIVGMASGYTAAQHQRSTEAPLIKAAGIRAVRMAVIATILRRLLNFLATVPEGDFYLQAIAVDPNVRGQGVGTILLDHMEQVSQLSGSRRIALDVAATNDGARKLYLRRSMTAEAESPKLFFNSRFSATRLVKSLAADK